MKDLSTIGHAIAKSDQKKINGGKGPWGPGSGFSPSCGGGGTACSTDSDCDTVFENGYCEAGCCAADNTPPQ
ncbi:MAG: hypothetical protein AAFQ94_22780 [Bacteroidota bacterium]